MKGSTITSRHLVGRTVIVTGGNGGIGFETAKDIANRGARVIIACRNDSRGITAKEKIVAATGNQDVHYRNLDFASLTSVRKFVDDFIKTEKRLDILINNAGVVEAEFDKSEDGLLLGMQINHFGPFLLTNLLLPLLKASAPSRIINVSSAVHSAGKVDFDNLNMEKETKKSYSITRLYANTKLCNILMTIELNRRLEGTGVTANALHPGVVNTNIMDDINTPVANLIVKPIFKCFGISPWEGAQTSIYLAVSPEVQNVSGRYFVNCKEEKPSKTARDPEVAKKLWNVSAKLVNLNETQEDDVESVNVRM